jgi:hypothetical protein
VQIGVHLSLVLLPEEADLMETRVADPRIGFFKSCFATPGGPAVAPAQLASQVGGLPHIRLQKYQLKN